MKENKNIWKKIIEVDDKTDIAFADPKDLRIAKTNVRQTDLTISEEIETDEKNLSENIGAIGLQQLPVSDNQGNIYIGGRRLKAFKILGKTLIPVVKPKKDLSKADQLTASWSENATKKDMTADEEGKVFKELCEKLTISHRKLAKKFQKPRMHRTIDYKIGCYKKFKLRSGCAVPLAKLNPKKYSDPTAFRKGDIVWDRQPNIHVPRFVFMSLIKRILASTAMSRSLKILTTIENVLDCFF